MKRKTALCLAAAVIISTLGGCEFEFSKGPDRNDSKPPYSESSSQNKNDDTSSKNEIIEEFPDFDKEPELPSESEPIYSMPEAPVKPVITAKYGDITKLDGTKQGWGPGTQLRSDGRPAGPVVFQEKYGKYGTYFIAPNENKIYITFDEGYENGYTPKILDTLKKKGVSAVFFVTMDFAKREPALVQRMIDEGHVVGNHSTTHPSMPEKSLEECKAEIQQLHDYILEKFGYEMWLFRPPRGEFSEQTLALANSMGYINVFWSFAYKDWETDNQMGAEAAFAKVTKAPHNGGIYLLHAVSKDNAEILGDVIDNFRERGFEVAPFDLKDDDHGDLEADSPVEDLPVENQPPESADEAEDAVIIDDEAENDFWYTDGDEEYAEIEITE